LNEFVSLSIKVTKIWCAETVIERFPIHCWENRIK
jgi:hypothetical protein